MSQPDNTRSAAFRRDQWAIRRVPLHSDAQALIYALHYSRRSHIPEGQPFERVPCVSKARYVLAVA